jgi:hypothetical protein
MLSIFLPALLILKKIKGGAYEITFLCIIPQQRTHATIYVGHCAFYAARAVSIPCEGGVSTSTVALRVVGGDEKGTQYLGATLFLGDINTGTWSSKLGSLDSEIVKCGHESRGTRS